MASLDDDEVQQLKDYLNKGPAEPEPRRKNGCNTAAPGRKRRGSPVAAAGKASGPLSSRKKSDDAEEVTPEETEEAQSVEETPAEPTPSVDAPAIDLSTSSHLQTFREDQGDWA